MDTLLPSEWADAKLADNQAFRRYHETFLKGDREAINEARSEWVKATERPRLLS
jgi:hypothetical protein